MLIHDLSETLAKAPDWQQGGARFWLLSGFNGGHSWIGKYSGTSLWEMHPEGDEFLYLLEGKLHFTLLTEERTDTTAVVSGQTSVVPRGAWHRQHCEGDVLMLGATTGTTRHSTAADPTQENRHDVE